MVTIKIESIRVFFLASMGIESFIPDEISAGVAPHFFMTRSSVRLQVDEEDEEKAKRIILEEYEKNDKEAGEQKGAGPSIED